MDNRLFNVNGQGGAMLAKALELAFMQHGNVDKLCEGWDIHPKKGFILYWHAEGKINKFLTKLSAPIVASDVYAWLQTVKPEQFELLDWEEDHDHDGSNSIGWRVYCENWGKVAEDCYAIVAIKPVYLWHGK